MEKKKIKEMKRKGKVGHAGGFCDGKSMRIKIEN